jgi:hypothetical protein
MIEHSKIVNGNVGVTPTALCALLGLATLKLRTNSNRRNVCRKS